MTGFVEKVADEAIKAPPQFLPPNFESIPTDLKQRPNRLLSSGTSGSHARTSYSGGNNDTSNRGACRSNSPVSKRLRLGLPG
jgi:hypothetical protein